jgi:sugar-specific transcriptional regulator TrmB
MPGAHDKILEALSLLGLTPLEAEVYRFLCAESSATGYRIAQATGKPVGNIYKAIEGLESKGAVICADDADSRVVRAVPPKEFVSRVRQSVEKACALTQARLAMPMGDEPDHRLYELSEASQVLARARAMLESASSFVIATVCPALVRELADDFAEAAARGVHVGVKIFERVEIPGVQIFVDHRGVAAVHSGPGQWLVMTADGRDILQALFDAEGEQVQTASWSEHPLLAWALFSGLSSDIQMEMVRRKIRDGASADEIAKGIDELSPFLSPRSASKLALMRKYRRPGPGRRERVGREVKE